jgi:hypothetical protein
MELGSYFLFLQEQRKDIIVISSHALPFFSPPVAMATPWLTCARAQGMRTGG